MAEKVGEAAADVAMDGAREKSISRFVQTLTGIVTLVAIFGGIFTVTSYFLPKEEIERKFEKVEHQIDTINERLEHMVLFYRRERYKLQAADIENQYKCTEETCTSILPPDMQDIYATMQSRIQALTEEILALNPEVKDDVGDGI